MTTETASINTTEPTPPAGYVTARRGKIARLPRAIRDQLNRRLDDSEAGPALLEWLNNLPEVKAILEKEFASRPISPQNLSEWRQGGFLEWAAKMEADRVMTITLEEARMQPSRRGRPKKAHLEPKSDSDKIAEWFFPFYVGAARARLAHASDPEAQWSVLRAICADLAVLRRSDHYLERLRIWRDKMALETSQVTEKEFLAWAKTQPDIEKKLWPNRHFMTQEEKQAKIRQILGTGPNWRRPGDIQQKDGSTAEKSPENQPVDQT